MPKVEIHVELLLGKRVFAMNGKSIGRIEEIQGHAENRNTYFVDEFLVGSYALFERLSAYSIGRAILQVLGVRRKHGWRIPWDMLDISDWEKPRLRCKVDQLPAFVIEE